MAWVSLERALIMIALVSFEPVSILSGQQAQTGRITGHVDVVGATIKDASVFVREHTASDTDRKLLTHTDIKGDFMLDLPDGGYDVLVTSPGFAASVKTIGVTSRAPRQASVEAKRARLFLSRHELRHSPVSR
jgi:hypothetical protein